MKTKAVNWIIAGCGAIACLAATSASAGIPPTTTTTTITGDKTNIAYGETVTLTATVTNTGAVACAGDAQIQPMPTPSVVTCGGPLTATLGSSELTCSVSGSALGAGTHNLGAVYQPGTCSASASTTDFTLTVAGPSAVPTTSEWTLWGLTGLLLIGGGAFVSRRFRAA